MSNAQNPQKPQNPNKAGMSAEEREARRKAAERVDATGTVTVACRLPCGLAVPIAGFDMAFDGTVTEAAQGMLRFRGANDKSALVDESGHGLTSGIPAKAWEAIQQRYAKAAWLTSGALFAKRKAADARGEAQERGEVNVGFNGVDQSAPAAGLEPVNKVDPAAI